MSQDNPTIMTYDTETVDPNELSPSEYHVRGETDVPDQMVESVSTVGIIQPPITRREEGDLRVLDGMRRVVAARQAEKETIDVLVADVEDAEAASLALSPNIDAWEKKVTDDDRETAMRKLVGGDVRPVTEWETTGDIEEAENRLGLVTEADRIERATKDLNGVGRSTAEELADAFGSLEDVREAEYTELREVRGIGGKRATEIESWFNRDDGVVLNDQ